MEINDVNITLQLVSPRITMESVHGDCHIKTLPHFSIVQVLKGNYKIGINDGKEEFTGEGGIFIAPPGYLQKITHYMDEKSGHMVARWIFFDMEINHRYSAELLYDFPVIPPKETIEKLTKLLDLMDSNENRFDRMSICYQIAKEIISVSREKNISYNNRILETENYIKANYKKKLSVSELSKIAYLSESAFHSLFKKQVGVSPVSYLNNYRLAIASKLLKQTDLSTETIANEVGINDVNYFAKIFKRKYRKTPSEYRKTTGF